MADNRVHEVRRIIESIRPHLAGKPPEVQSAALAELVSLWYVGNHPELRAELWSEWLRLVADLNDMNEPWLPRV